MEWQRPEALYLILPLCAAWFVLALDSNRRRQRARAAFAAPAMWSRLMPRESRIRFWMKLFLKEIAIITGLVALAGPRFGTEYEQVVPRGADLYVLIDVSRSMLADDVPPSRLGRAKADVSSLLNRLQGERVGLIAFAGQAVVKCPLTVDYDSFRRSLEELDPDSAPRGGTAIGDAIRKGLEVFHSNADRDQAMILITDGDDQQSYPLEAAALAHERHVTIFAIGLGDAERGARIPQKGNVSTFVEYQGEQVWSKLDNNLLEQIALKTSGVYVPAGTRAYDLGELYTNHLQGRNGHDAAAQQKIRHSERFQLFLAISLFAMLLDLCISPYRRSGKSEMNEDQPVKAPPGKTTARAERASIQLTLLAGICGLLQLGSLAAAAEPGSAVREGLRFYSREQYDEAMSRFEAATEELDKQKSAAAAVAAFDEACAAHRKGDLERAKEKYLRAGLSQDRSLAVSAHYNLGMLAAEKAKSLSGEKPELVPPEKRQEILDQLAQAIAAYRHCIELQSEHVPSRRNIELIRQWIKYYSDKWHEQDRQKRRDESDLIKFLEFLIQSETALKETVGQLREPVRSDTFAELKRAQEELQEEIPTLREKIDAALRPQPDPQTGTTSAAPQELEEGIKLLQSWADTAAARMSAASRKLTAKDAAEAMAEQQSAIDELERIWEGVVPFHPLLAKELAEQTAITKVMNVPHNAGQDSASNENSNDEQLLNPQVDPPEATAPADPADPSQKETLHLEIEQIDYSKLEEMQTRTLKRAQLLAPKAESELQQLEKVPPGDHTDDLPSTDTQSPHTQLPVDPEELKAGYRKAIELAPQAVEKMEAAIKSMKQQDHASAALRAEEARKILEEIQNAQPKNEQKQQQNQDQNQDQQKQDQSNDQNQSQDEKQADDQKQDEDQKNEEQKKQDSSDKSKQEKDEKNDPHASGDKKEPVQLSRDQLEDALRKVRERQQEKRERDRKLKGQFLGRTPVDKDW